MTNLAPRALGENYAPGFYVKHILKDMKSPSIARPPRTRVPGLAVARRLYDQVSAHGWDDCGTQVLYRL